MPPACKTAKAVRRESQRKGRVSIFMPRQRAARAPIGKETDFQMGSDARNRDRLQRFKV